jgi:hypothetical protein
MAGEFLPHEIPVVVEYVETNYMYGEDADGNRARACTDRVVVDVWISEQDLKRITPELAKFAIDNAEEIFRTRR